MIDDISISLPLDSRDLFVDDTRQVAPNQGNISFVLYPHHLYSEQLLAHNTHESMPRRRKNPLDHRLFLKFNHRHREKKK